LSSISIIIPSYNKSDFILETIFSVLNQTANNWELIVVDDCSTDDTPSLLKEHFLSQPNVQLVFNSKNQGANYCRNQGLELAQGDYVMFLDADDLMMPCCVAQRTEGVLASPQCDVAVFPMGVFYKEPGDADKAMYWLPQKEAQWLDLFLKHQLPWQTMQPVWRSSFIKQLGGFDLKFDRLQDVEIHTRALLNGAIVKSFHDTRPDVFFRIDEERTGVSTFRFYEKLCMAAIQYYELFYEQVNQSQQFILTGTLFEPLTMICYQKRIGKITKSELMSLSSMLIDACKDAERKKKLKRYLQLENISPVHPKGLKAYFKKRLKL
jgi:glycosyltransferase involved in cell wall biosynthesis